jgi:DNA-directed RNA polymerase
MAAITAYVGLRSDFGDYDKDDDECSDDENEDPDAYVATLCENLGAEIVEELNWRQHARDYAAELDESEMDPARIKHEPGANPDKLDHRAKARLERRIEDGDAVTEWPMRQRRALGWKLLELLVQVELADEQGQPVRPFRFDLVPDGRKRRGIPMRRRALVLDDYVRGVLDDWTASAELAMPRLLPMLHKPRDWEYDGENKARGGFLTLRKPLIPFHYDEHTNALEKPVSDFDLHSTNLVQQTPFRIHQRVFKEMERRFMRSLRPFEKKPDRQFIDQYVVARRFLDEPRFWFAWRRDYRGRIYPLAKAGPNPQSDDAGRSLLEFAEGKPLGERGIQWLMIHFASTFGLDKHTRAERLWYALHHKKDIMEAAADPAKHDWWLQAKKPWEVLAAIFELAAAWDSGDPRQYISHLPIPLDATSSGIQHLVLLMRDHKVAPLVNLTKGGRPSDLYALVGDAMKAVVDADMHNCAPLLRTLLGDSGLRRDLAKPPTMTFAYGSTTSAIRKQIKKVLKKAGIWLDCDYETWKAAVTYLAKVIDNERGRQLEFPEAAMGWLQRVAELLAVKNRPFEWITPTGSRCRQSKHHKDPNGKIRFAGMGALCFAEPTDELNVTKQKNAAAPNFVHSLDAAHLSMTVTACREQGIRSFALAHDSYAVLAADVDTLRKVLPEQFVKLHAVDRLDELVKYLRARHPDIEFPDPPPRGELDISDITESEYSFN